MRAMYMLMSSRMGSVTIISMYIISKLLRKNNEIVLTEWSKKSLGDDFAERCLEQLLLGGDVGIAGLFAQTLRTPAKQGGRKSLGNGEGEKEDDSSEDHVDPNDPSPANRLTNETANDGSKDRATVRSGSEKSDRESSLIVVPDVGYGATSEC